MADSFPNRDEIRREQLQSLHELLAAILPDNAFYGDKLSGVLPGPIASLDDYAKLFPFTNKSELSQDQVDHPPYGRNLTFPIAQYCRLHQTSGTTGKPLRWLDTRDTWNNLVECWQEVYRAAGVTQHDVCYFAFSFGPFLGFWLAFDAGSRVGCLCVPGGGQSTLARLQTILQLNATVLCCTPSYAIHMAEVAAQERMDLSKSRVKLIIVAGEAGGSIPATRAHIERLWPGARVFDHHGMTEVGPVTFECPAQSCRLHVIDSGYLAEVVHPGTGEPVPIGTPGELVLTTLKRNGSPLLRYRTGDVVKLAAHHAGPGPCVCGRFNTTLEGGILGRTDDMVVVRGVNIYPSAIEQIMREFGQIAEYQAHITTKGAMTEMYLQIEPTRETKDPAALTIAVEKELQRTFNLRIPVASRAPGSLPRTELKAKRWIKT